MSSLERAIVLATTAHSGQVDKAGAPYILHPLRVMLAMDTLIEQIVAVLHDVVEDTSYTTEALRTEGFCTEVIEGVAVLTHGKDETYDDYLTRVKSNPLALKVKLADLNDNMNLERLPYVTGKDTARLIKYKRARSFLTLSPSIVNESTE